MKTLILIPVIAVLLNGCAGSGGPVERTGRTVDHGVQKTGEGVEKVGEKIQEAAR